MPDTYRRCAAIVVLRKPPTSDWEVLLVHKPRKKDDWQLPQGGAEEGESTAEAAIRELKEEAGVEATVLATSATIYQYDFPTSYRRFRPDHICGQQIEFVFGTIAEDATVKVDANEIDKHTWAKKSDLVQYIRRPEYLKVVTELFEEALTLVT